eukprot:6212759-Pleurochrysis_carterae.AAC.3
MCMEDGAGLINDPGEEEWLVRYASAPIEVAKLPVQAVVLGSVGKKGDGTRGPADILCGNSTCHAKHADCKENGWTVFLAYVPGSANFASTCAVAVCVCEWRDH